MNARRLERNISTLLAWNLLRAKRYLDARSLSSNDLPRAIEIGPRANARPDDPELQVDADLVEGQAICSSGSGRTHAGPAWLARNAATPTNSCYVSTTAGAGCSAAATKASYLEQALNDVDGQTVAYAVVLSNAGIC